MAGELPVINISFDHNTIKAQKENSVFIRLDRPNTEEKIKCTIKNNSYDAVNLHSYSHVCRSTVLQVAFKEDDKVREGTSHRLHPQGSYIIYVRLSFVDERDCASVKVRMRFDFSICGVEQQNITEIKSLICNVVPPQYQEMHTYLIASQRIDHTDFSHSADDDDEDYNLIIVWLDSAYVRYESELEVVIDIPTYGVPRSIRGMVNNKWEQWPPETIIQELDLHLRGWSNYREFFDSLLYLEELQLQKDIGAYTLRRAVIKRTNFSIGDRRQFKIEVPGLLEKRPSVLRGDRIFAKPLIDRPKFKYEGEVVYIAQRTVSLIFHEQFDDDIREIIDSTIFKIEFRFNRLPIKLMHRALEMAIDKDMENILFPTATDAGNRAATSQQHQLQFYNQNVKKNREQKRAVEHIVRGTSKPAPYIIYGPPGTGKTFTLVEAIKQVYKASKANNKVKILVCAPTNHAADLVARGLRGDVAEKDVLRMNAKSRPHNQCDPEIMVMSNINGAETGFRHPSKEFIEEKTIVVTTLSTSGWLVSADLSNHFTHIFIDEAGFATEPETLIPLAVLEPYGQIVLAGDPQQLGAVIRSKLAKDCGLGISLLERLMNKPDGPYRPDADGKYNPNYVTKLVNSFRSHPDILKIPNELFYNNELIACADVTAREMFCSWTDLPKKAAKSRCPMIFHGVEGMETQLRDSPSWLNNEEAICVVEYIKKLLGTTHKPNIAPGKIGVISPYHRQVKEIRKLIDRTVNLEGADKIKVGSVEKFQGDEREVIIISTVRSENSTVAKKHDEIGLGFVAEPKRFNVAVTRTKALLIVVGNPFALIHDANWRKLIVWIKRKGGYRGNQNESRITEALRETARPATDDQGAEGGASDYQQFVDDEFEPQE